MKKFAFIAAVALIAGASLGTGEAEASAREICKSACRAAYDACRAGGLGVFGKKQCKDQRNSCWNACGVLPD